MLQEKRNPKGAGRKPGSPNKRKRELDELITEDDVALCMQTIKNAIANSENKRLRLDAAFYLLDQKFGKARQRNEITGANGNEFILEIKDYRGK